MLETLLWQQLIYDPDRRAGSVLSLITVAALVGEFSFPDAHSQAAYFQRAFPVILPWVLTPHVTVGYVCLKQFPALTFGWVVITIPYHLMLQSWYPKNVPIIGEHVVIIFVTQ